LISKRNAEIRRKEKQYLNIKETDFKNLKQKTAEKQQDIRLFASQKEAIKFVLDKGRGLVGLDTGCGKTLVAICVILKWIEDGTLRQKGRNGKALIVAEASLQGNFQREIENYCDNASEIMKHIDIITYQGFTKGMVLGEAFQHGAASYDKLENYGAVIFDEAQALKNIPKMKNIEEKEETGEEATGDVEEAFLDEKETDDTNEELKAKGIKKTMNRAMAAHSLNHEHKVLLTASVMEKNPEEFFNLVSITNNEPLETLEIRKKEFKRRHLNTTGKFGGGRVIGVKGDKKSKRIMGDFVRENCVSVRKDQNKIITPEGKEELVPIPKLIKESPSITVDRRLQDIYLEIASPMLNTLKKMTGDFEALAKDPTKVETEGIGIFQKYTKGEGMEVTSKEDAYNQFIKIFRMLQLLSSAPTNLIPAYPAYFEARPEMKAVLEQADKYDSKLKFITGQIDKEQDEKWILWTDTPLIADYYYANLTKAFPSREIAVAYANKILIQKGGERQKEYVESIVESKLKEKTGRKEFERVEWKDVDGKPMKYNKNWQIDALKEIKKKPEVLVLILTKAYTKGHNLQNFTRTIHLDRDSFNNQNMQQRDARNHRNGANPEKDMVSFTPDAVLDEKYASFSVDKIRKYLQDLEQHIFDVVIRQSFENVPERPYEMKVEGPSQMILKKKKEMLHKAISQMKIDKKTLEYILSPTVNTIKEIEK